MDGLGIENEWGMHGGTIENEDRKKMERRQIELIYAQDLWIDYMDRIQNGKKLDRRWISESYEIDTLFIILNIDKLANIRSHL